MSLLAVFASVRKKAQPKEISWRSVSCKKCGVQIALSNQRLENEFSIKCTACDHRAFYSDADVAVTVRRG